MSKISKDIFPEYEKTIDDAIKTKDNDLDKAINLMNIFCHVISTYLNEQKKIFDEENPEWCEFFKDRV